MFRAALGSSARCGVELVDAGSRRAAVCFGHWFPQKPPPPGVRAYVVDKSVDDSDVGGGHADDPEVDDGGRSLYVSLLIGSVDIGSSAAGDVYV
jgi:hypothetical protein